MSVIAPTTFTTNLLICDSIFTGTIETVPTTVSCGIELQSTKSAFCMSRLTNAQIADPTFIPANGMIIYNTSTDQFNMYQNGTFAVVNAAVPGTITGPGASTDTAIVRWAGVSGDVLEDSIVLVDDLGNVTGTLTIANDLGAPTAPSYAFAGALDTGMYASSVGRIDFATGGARQVKIGNNPTAVNYVQLDGALTTDSVIISGRGTDVDVNIDLNCQGSGFVSVSSVTGAGKLAFYNDTSTFYSAFQAGNPGVNVTWTLPVVDATIAGQVLSSDATGILSWVTAGTGDVTGPGASTDTAIVLWDGVTGTLVQDSVVAIDPLGNVTGTLTIANDLGTNLAPSYTFAGSLDTGMYAAGVGQIDFATGGARQVKIGNNPTAVNYVQFDGSAAGLGVDISAFGVDANIDIGLISKGNGFVTVGNGVSPGKLAFYNAAATNYSAFQAGNPVTDVTWTLPLVDAVTAGEVLSSDAAGTLSWVAPTVQVVTFTVSSAQLLSLNTTAVDIIPAPGAGNIISINNAAMEYVFNTTPYTVPGGAVLQLFVNTVEVGSDIDAAGLVDQGSNKITFTKAVNQTTGITASLLDNKPLTITNTVGDFTVGDGTLVVTVYYTIIPV